MADTAGKTIFICSHILPIMEELCDRIGIINQGRLIAIGTVDEIIAQTGTKTLEKAFIAITGVVEEKELLVVPWRALENLSNIIYITGLFFPLAIFIVPKSEPMGPMYVYMMAQFLFPVLVVMINGEVTVRGKESLFMVRKTPSGEGKFIKALLLKGWLTAVPIAGAMTLVPSLPSAITL